MIEKALETAMRAHKDQKDLGGHPYILHPLTVMLSMDSVDEKCAAILHDVVEDSSITIEELRTLGFSRETVYAVDLLTKQGLPYAAYIEAIAANPIARKVKIADIRHNMDVKRLRSVTAADMQRLRRYQKALQVLQT